MQSDGAAEAEQQPDAALTQKLVWLIVATLITTVFNLIGTAAAAWLSFAHDDQAIRRGQRTEACTAALTAAQRLVEEMNAAHGSLRMRAKGPEMAGLYERSSDLDKQMQAAISQLSLVSSDDTSVGQARELRRVAQTAKFDAIHASGLTGPSRDQKIASVAEQARHGGKAQEQLTAACRRQVE